MGPGCVRVAVVANKVAAEGATEEEVAGCFVVRCSVVVLLIEEVVRKRVSC